MWEGWLLQLALWFGTTPVGHLLLSDTACIAKYAEGGALTVYMLRREIADPSDYDTLQVTLPLRYSDRLGLWTVLSHGVNMRILLPEMPGSTTIVSPLVLAIQSRYQEDPDQEYDLPNTIQALLWACCSPHDFGLPEVSPLCQALRSGDDMAVSLLLQHKASPSRREEDSNDPIFVAIQMSSAENVHRLLQYEADPRSGEAVPSREGHAGRRRLRRRAALEAAASQPRCRRVLLDFLPVIHGRPK